MPEDQDVPPLEGVPDEVLDEDGMVRRFALDPARRKVDKAAHYPNCHWALVERKTSKVKDAVDQLTVTLQQIDREKFDVKRLIVVYDRIGDSRLFHIRRREGRPPRSELYHRGRKSRVEVGGIHVEAYRRDEVREMYKQRRVTDSRR